MEKLPELYFEDAAQWREWLHENHGQRSGVQLILYKVDHHKKSMRWEEAVKVALCYGWIDSTVKSLGNGRRRQYFCPRKPKSVWSKLNKSYIRELRSAGLLHESGIKVIETAKKNGSWTALDDVENGVIPDDLQREFNSDPLAFKNYSEFSWTYQKSYLYWLNQAKRPATREKRLREIVELCRANIKSRT